MLIAIPLLVLLFFFLIRWKKKVIKRIGDERLIKALISNYSQKLFTSKFIFLTLAFTVGIIALMNPRKPGSSENFTRKGIDVVIALDVSKSMLAADIQPSRLEKAKEFMNKLIDEMPDNRIGLILFAGAAYLQMPLTIDQGAAKMYISTASPDAVPQQGTVISEALNRSANAFSDKDERFKGVVLITDGEDHDPDGIKTAQELADQGVMINTIGIGSQEGSPIIDPATGTEKKDAAGGIVISKLNEDELKQIAEKTNGIYIHLQNSDEAVNTLSGYLSQIEKKAFVDKASLDYSSFYSWLTAVMFIILVAENFIPERKKIAV